jgi:leucyl/phenylalanyl-tRNA--protein transferase
MQNLTPDLLLKAYMFGVFPMAQSRHDPTLYWLNPERRGVLPLDRFHVPRKLARLVRREHFTVRVDTAFAATLAGCAAPGPKRRDTWINDRLMTLYDDLHRLGHAHSVECWREGQLVGGIYGVSLGGAFFGESMFSAETNASKVALVHLVARLRAGGYSLFDTQFVTAHLARFGALEIPRADYQRRLQRALAQTADIHSLAADASGETVVQWSTQTS